MRILNLLSQSDFLIKIVLPLSDSYSSSEISYSYPSAQEANSKGVYTPSTFPSFITIILSHKHSISETIWVEIKITFSLFISSIIFSNRIRSLGSNPVVG